MSDIYWPETLPAARVEFGGKETHGTIRTQMDSGRVRQRRRFLAKQKSWGFELIMDDAQYAIFQAFFTDDLDGGANYFYMNIADSDGITSTKVRCIGGEYGFKQIPPDHWAIQLDLESGYN
jgi:hypothetical protein